MINLQNQIYVMRHGQSENNILGIESCLLETQTKFGLTSDGKVQVEKSSLAFSSFDIIYSSPYRRTLESADIMAQTSECEVMVETGIQEFRLPSRFDQAPYEEAEALIHHPDNDLKTRAIEDSETFETLFERVKSSLENINQLHTQKNILVVSHGSPVEAALQVMRGQCTGFGPFENLPKNAEVIHLNALQNV